MADPENRWVQAVVPVVENVRLARDTYRLRFRFPALAARIQAGQFVMVRVPGRTDPLLGRAFALYDLTAEDVDIVFLVVGKMTRLLAGLAPGAAVEVWGPLGNGFPDYAGTRHLILVAGGIGQTPFLTLLRREVGRGVIRRASLYYGARSADLFAGLDDFRATGATLHLATDDGSAGFHGFITQLLEQHWPALGEEKCRLVGCGPEPMLHALADLAARWEVACDVSLETPMACGVGVCFSCVTRVRTADGWDYRRVCVEGPVFDAATVAW
jgi:dihydroorotate dehydrogenase electron transfer subunit